jgi:hypothetical protein
MIGIIKIETVEYDKLRIIRNESSYQWVKDKSELAEIIFKILKTKSVESKNSQEVNELKFSRELAAFFGIHKLNPYKHYYSKKT